MSEHIDAIIKLLSSRSYKPATESEIRRKLGIRKHQKKAFFRDLKKLRRQGRIKKTRGGYYILVVSEAQPAPVMFGMLKRKNGSFYLVNSDGEFRLPELINPLHAVVGDEVVVRIERKRRGPVARIVRVVSRKYSRIIGYVHRFRSGWVVEPVDRDIHFNLVVENPEGLKESDVVLCEVTEFPEFSSRARCRIVKVYGDQFDDRIDESVTIDKYNLPHIFGKGVKEELEWIHEPDESDMEGREDFRHLPTITIDGEDAKDFDDAVDVERRGNGYRLYVHIADVSHYVKQGSELDREALKRGFSVYFPGSVIPMLPFKLSDDICSLRPNRDRLTLSVVMDIDARGRIKRYSFLKSVITSKNRMTYTQVQGILDGEIECDPELEKNLKRMAELAYILRKKRFKEGSIDLDIPEPEFVIEDGKIVDIRARKRFFSHCIIEEFMLAANLCAADFLDKHFDVYIRRVHDEPDVKKIQALVDFLKRFGIKHSIDKKRVTSIQLQRLLNSIRDERKREIISYLVLRSMKRAEYSTEAKGHFALGFRNYTHFTSPIRRYPDLVVHRMIKSVLDNSGRGDFGDLEFIAASVREREIVTEEAEFYMNDVKSAAFMRQYIGERFKGTIVNIIPAGIFVRLNRYFVEGFISVDRMKDDYYVFYEELFAMVGRRKHKLYRVGDDVKVVPVSVNKFAGEIDLIFA